MIKIRLASLTLRTATRPGLALCPLGLASRDRALSRSADVNGRDDSDTFGRGSLINNRVSFLAEANLKWLAHYWFGTWKVACVWAPR